MAVVTPGNQTSEFKLSFWVVVIGTLLDGVGVLLGILQDSGILKASWLPVAIVIIGTVLIGAKALGYTRSRTMLKLAESAPGASQVLADSKESLSPLALAVKELVREEVALIRAKSVSPPSSP